MKLFLDANILVSAMVLGSASHELLVRAAKAGWRLCVSDYVLGEAERVASTKLGVPRGDILRLAAWLRQAGEWVQVPPSRHVVLEDPADTPVLRGALAGGCDYLVTRDKHLLSMDPYESLRIVTVADLRQSMIDLGSW